MISPREGFAFVARKLLPMPLRNVIRPYWHRVTLGPSDETLRAREIATLGPAERWPRFHQEEIDYWDWQLNNRTEAYPWWYPLVSDPNALLQDHLRELVNAPPGSRVDGREVHITPLDPNVDGYDGLLAKHGIVPPCRTVFGLAEELDFPEHSFDLVNARNSVDHSKDALQAIREMVRVVKKGCFVCLNHKVSEGRLEKYAEYHQWNLIAGGSSSSALECGPPM